MKIKRFVRTGIISTATIGALVTPISAVIIKNNFSNNYKYRKITGLHDKRISTFSLGESSNIKDITLSTNKDQDEHPVGKFSDVSKTIVFDEIDGITYNRKNIYVLANQGGIYIKNIDNNNEGELISKDLVVKNSLYLYKSTRDHKFYILYKSIDGFLKRIDITSYKESTEFDGASKTETIMEMDTDGFISYNIRAISGKDVLEFAYSDDKGVYYVSDIKTPKEKDIIGNSWVHNAWGKIYTSNGARVLFYGGEEGMFKQDLQKITGNGGKKIVDMDLSNSSIAFSLDGSHLVFTSLKKGLWNLNILNNATKLIDSSVVDNSSIIVYRDKDNKEKMIYSTTNYGIWVIDAMTGSRRQISSESPIDGLLKFVFSNDIPGKTFTKKHYVLFKLGGDLKRVTKYVTKYIDLDIPFAKAKGSLEDIKTLGYTFVRYSAHKTVITKDGNDWTKKNIYFAGKKNGSVNTELWKYDGSNFTKVFSPTYNEISASEIKDMQHFKFNGKDYYLTSSDYDELIVSDFKSNDKDEKIDGAFYSSFYDIYYDTTSKNNVIVYAKDDGLYTKTIDNSKGTIHDAVSGTAKKIVNGSLESTKGKVIKTFDGKYVLILHGENGIRFIDLNSLNADVSKNSFTYIKNDSAKHSFITQYDYKGSTNFIYSLDDGEHWSYNFKTEKSTFVGNLDGGSIEKMEVAINYNQPVIVYSTTRNGVWYKNIATGKNANLSKTYASDGFLAAIKEGDGVRIIQGFNGKEMHSYTIPKPLNIKIDKDVSEGNKMITFIDNGKQYLVYITDDLKIKVYDVAAGQSFIIADNVDEDSALNVIESKVGAVTKHSIIYTRGDKSGVWSKDFSSLIADKTNASKVVSHLVSTFTINGHTITGEGKIAYITPGGEVEIYELATKQANKYLSGISKDSEISSYIDAEGKHWAMVQTGSLIKLVKFEDGTTKQIDVKLAKNELIKGRISIININEEDVVFYSVYRKSGTRTIFKEKRFMNLNTKVIKVLTNEDILYNDVYTYKVNGVPYIIYYSVDIGIIRQRIGTDVKTELLENQWKFKKTKIAIVTKGIPATPSGTYNQQFLIYQSNKHKGLWIKNLMENNDEVKGNIWA